MTADNPSPLELRDQWRQYCREQKKQQVIIDAMTAMTAVVDEAIANGSTSMLPNYGSPALMAEALRECVSAHRDVQAYFAVRAKNALDAFNAAVQQN